MPESQSKPAEISRLRVVVFSKDADYESLAMMGVQKVKDTWQGSAFNKPSYALEELDVTVAALITSLPRNSEPSMRLINRSNELEIPRAIMSPYEWAHEYARNDSLDIVISTTQKTLIPNIVQSWLRHITEARKHN